MLKKKQIRIILIAFCFIFFLIIYKRTLYTPNLFESDKRSLIDKSFDFFCFGWHHLKASIYEKYFRNSQVASKEYAKAGWYRKRYLIKRFRIKEPDIGSIVNLYRKLSLDSILEKIYINSLKNNSLETSMLMEAGFVFIKRENWDMALKVYSEILKQNMNDPISHYYLGLVYLKLKMRPESVNSFEMAVKINPDFADAYYQIGYIAERENNLTRALQYYRITISFLPNHLEGLKALKRLSGALGDS